MSVNQYEKLMNELFWDKSTKLFGYSNTMKPNNEELTDFFIPFEEDILLVEDKSKDGDIELPDGINIYNIKKDEENFEIIKREWNRVLKGKINKAIKQLNGAELYLKSKGIVYKNRNKVESNIITYNEKAKMHKIVLLHSIDKACQQYYDSDYGGLVYQKFLKNNEENDNIFSLFSYGKLDRNTHIFTEQQFVFLNTYLPTLSDILSYLNWKERLFDLISIVGMDEFSLICYYIEYGDYLIEKFSNIEKEVGKPINNIILEVYDDDSIHNLENTNKIFIRNKNSSNAIKRLLKYLDDNKGKDSSDIDLRDKLLRFYLRLDIEAQLGISENIQYILSNNKSSLVNSSCIYKKCLYLFVNLNTIITEDIDVYSYAFISKFGIRYIEKYKNEVDIQDIVLCLFYKDENNELCNIFTSLNLVEFEKDYSFIKDVKKDILKIDSLLPQRIDYLFDDYIKKNNFNLSLKNKFNLKGKDRNKLCPCGSGKKYKKCCGK